MQHELLVDFVSDVSDCLICFEVAVSLSLVEGGVRCVGGMVEHAVDGCLDVVGACTILVAVFLVNKSISLLL